MSLSVRRVWSPALRSGSGVWGLRSRLVRQVWGVAGFQLTQRGPQAQIAARLAASGWAGLRAQQGTRGWAGPHDFMHWASSVFINAIPFDMGAPSFPVPFLLQTNKLQIHFPLI